VDRLVVSGLVSGTCRTAFFSLAPAFLPSPGPSFDSDRGEGLFLELGFLFAF